MRRLALPVGYQVVLPFLLLSMLAGLAASALVGVQLAAAARAQLDTEAIREEDSVSSSFATFEQRQLTDLRTLAATDGVGRAVKARDRASLQRLIVPAVSAQLPDPLRASVVIPDGTELLSARADQSHVSACICAGGRQLGSWSHVNDALSGRSDKFGPKYIGIAADSDGPVMYTVGPVTLDGATVGAILVAEPLNALLHDLRTRQSFEVGLYRAGGGLISANTVIPASSSLSAADRRAVTGHAGFIHRQLARQGSQYEVFYVPWRLRHEDAGYAAVVRPAAALGSVSTQIPLLMAAVFGTVFVVTVATGLYISRRITRPLDNLVRATHAVGGGDLQYQAAVMTSDEIGELTVAFNAMTTNLLDGRAQIGKSAEATIQTLAFAIDARDSYTHGHSVRVTRYSVELARCAGFGEEDLERLRRGCLVHDIGKIGIPDRILSKAGPLTRRQWEAMRRHPELGAEMLAPLEWPAEVLQIVRSHHERWDGTGYPDKLTGDETPRLARLVAICDTLDAMTSDRPYRHGFPYERAAAEIEAGAGTQFDPEMVRHFVSARDVLATMVAELQASSTATADGLLEVAE
ncbi:MAG: HD domain-containing phosphohydrolase [Candidatus Dormibacteria bacterium]